MFSLFVFRYLFFNFSLFAISFSLFVFRFSFFVVFFVHSKSGRMSYFDIQNPILTLEIGLDIVL